MSSVGRTTFSFPRGSCFPASHSGGTTEDKTKKGDLRPAHTCASGPGVSSSHPAPYLGHFVHRDRNSVDGERWQL